ncbi:MAG: YbaK/EbsC family protein [Acidobacteriota bacterium]
MRPQGLLFMGQRAVNKLAGALRAELEALGGQEVGLNEMGAMTSAAGGDLRSYKQLPQVWYQRNGNAFEIGAVGLDAAALRGAIERGCSVPLNASDPEEGVPEDFSTPGVKTIEDLVAFSGQPATSLIKSIVMVSGGALILILVRGDHSLSEAKLRQLLGGDAVAASAEQIRASFGADPGSLGPVGVSGMRILIDGALRGRLNLIAGANRDDFHKRNVTPGRDFQGEFHDLRVAGEVGTPVIANDGQVVGWSAAGAPVKVLNESGVAVEAGTVVASIDLAAVLASVPRDELGLVMPPMMAPFSVVFTPVNVKMDDLRLAAESLYEQARAAGCDAVLDDRDERPGVKFKDSDLTGIPWRVTVGKKLAEGLVEVNERSTRQSWEVPVGELVEFVRVRWDAIA